MITNIENFRKKLLFRSTHRGTKEMDLLLGGFFKENQNSLSEVELLEFEKILAKGSPLASMEMAVVIFVQIDIQKSSL